MALNFPNSPNLNDTHTHNGLTWVWNGSVWEMQGSGGASVTVSDNAPSSPTHGDMWWESDTGDLKIYYDESETGAGSGAFWVSANGADSMVGISTNAPTNPQTGDLWWDSDVAALYMYYNDGNSSQWVSAASGATGAQGAAGAAGAQGATGSGATGAQGAAGAQGASGAAGAQGASGAAGAQGSTGPVAGSSTQVVYKDGSNNPAGSSNFTFDGTNLTVNGNVSIGGTLTYEDVTNIDSVGIITARDKIKLTSADGQIEATGATGLSINASGASAFARFYTANTERLRINANGIFDFKDNSFTNVGSIALDFIKGDADDDTNITFAGNDVITFKAGSTSPALTINTTQVKIEDDQKFVAGTGNDLQIYHSSGDAYITNSDGNLNIVNSTDGWIRLQPRSGEEGVIVKYDGAVELYHDNSKKLETTSNGIQISGDQVLDGHLDMRDSDRIRLGAGDDLSLYHNAANSFIDNTTGSLYIRGIGDDLYLRATDDIFIQPNGNVNGIIVTGGGAVELYHNNSRKLETTSAGITVYNNVDFSSSTGRIRWPEHSNAASRAWDLIGEQGAYGRMELKYGGADGATPDEVSWRAIVNQGVELYYDNSKKFSTATDGATMFGNLGFRDNDKIEMGQSSDLRIYHDGSHSFVSDMSTGNLKLTSNGTAVQIEKSDGENMAIFRTDGSVDLYHDNSLKFQTTSGGIEVTGNCQASQQMRIYNANGSIYFGTSSGGYGPNSAIGRAQVAQYHASGSAVGDLVIGAERQKSIVFGTTSNSTGGLSGRCRITGAGNFEPMSNNSRDLGSSSLRWRNIYTNDLNLSNEGSTNDVDGTWGDYTIQEGEG